MERLVVATFNVHGGVDGWGRPYDVVGGALSLDADVLVVQELFRPTEGPSCLDDLVERGGYTALAAPGADGWIFHPDAHAGPTPGWGPVVSKPPGVGLRVQWSARRPLARVPGTGTGGTLSMVMFTRVPVTTSRLIDLGQLPGDVPRSAGMVEVMAPSGPLAVVGTHMSHLRQGSPIQFRRLRLAMGNELPQLLVGDMNCWGPPLTMMFPGWRRPVRGRTWPSWRPVFQIDHALASPGLEVTGSVVNLISGSDHLPIRLEVC